MFGEVAMHVVLVLAVCAASHRVFLASLTHDTLHVVDVDVDAV